MNGESSFGYYKKPAKKPLFVHHQSALPRNSKINFTHNERRCIQQKCSTQTTFNKHNREFNHILHLNRYPEDALDESKNPQNHPRDPKSQNYISESCSSLTDWIAKSKTFRPEILSDFPPKFSLQPAENA